ncbi:hypothetical protein B0H14DRAFT_3429075 [Mycena olivaceomarginata]|nr:hypothetical protein B0H14DRAFT_3429075 [Mycena olivaceomarginata]
MAEEDSTLPDPHDNVEPLDYKEQFKGRRPSEFVDMDQNNYDRNACMDYFQAYRDCKAAWIERRKDDRRNGRISD